MMPVAEPGADDVPPDGDPTTTPAIPDDDDDNDSSNSSAPVGLISDRGDMDNEEEERIKTPGGGGGRLERGGGEGATCRCRVLSEQTDDDLGITTVIIDKPTADEESESWTDLIPLKDIPSTGQLVLDSFDGSILADTTTNVHPNMIILSINGCDCSGISIQEARLLISSTVGELTIVLALPNHQQPQGAGAGCLGSGGTLRQRSSFDSSNVTTTDITTTNNTNKREPSRLSIRTSTSLSFDKDEEERSIYEDHSASNSNSNADDLRQVKTLAKQWDEEDRRIKKRESLFRRSPLSSMEEEYDHDDQPEEPASPSSPSSLQQTSTTGGTTTKKKKKKRKRYSIAKKEGKISTIVTTTSNVSIPGAHHATMYDDGSMMQTASNASKPPTRDSGIQKKGLQQVSRIQIVAQANISCNINPIDLESGIGGGGCNHSDSAEAEVVVADDGSSKEYSSSLGSGSDHTNSAPSTLLVGGNNNNGTSGHREVDNDLHLVEASLVDDQQERTTGNPNNNNEDVVQLAEVVRGSFLKIPELTSGKLFCLGILALPTLIILVGIVCGGGYCAGETGDDSIDIAQSVTGSPTTTSTPTSNVGSSSQANYCGSSWTDAARSCGSSCPGGLDNECPQGQRCFADITSCGTEPATNYCGGSWAEAATSCATTCRGGMDLECPQGQKCFGDITSCNIRLTTTENNFCGYTWEGGAAKSCINSCPGGVDSECPRVGQRCFACGTGITTNYCGNSWAEVSAFCEGFCPGGLDSECPQGQKCFNCNGEGEEPLVEASTITTSTTTTTTTTTNFCGSSWADASNTCGSSCPGGMDGECPQGQTCFGDITSCSSTSDGNSQVFPMIPSVSHNTTNRPSQLPSTIAPVIVSNSSSSSSSSTTGAEEDPKIIATTNFCGSSWTDAASACGTSCPGGMDSECPEGQSCFGDVTSCGTTEDGPITNYCGVSWTEAANSCGTSCPGGMDNECPEGQACFGDITSCSSS